MEHRWPEHSQQLLDRRGSAVRAALHALQVGPVPLRAAQACFRRVLAREVLPWSLLVVLFPWSIYIGMTAADKNFKYYRGDLAGYVGVFSAFALTTYRVEVRQTMPISSLLTLWLLPVCRPSMSTLRA